MVVSRWEKDRDVRGRNQSHPIFTEKREEGQETESSAIGEERESHERV